MERKVLLLSMGTLIALLMSSIALIELFNMSRPSSVQVYGYSIMINSRSNYRLYVLVGGETRIADENKGPVRYEFTCISGEEEVINVYSEEPFNLTIFEHTPTLWILKNETLVQESHTVFYPGDLDPR